MPICFPDSGSYTKSVSAYCMKKLKLVSLARPPCVNAVNQVHRVKDWPLPIRLPRHHDDVIKWKNFPRYWPFHRSPVNSPHKGQWRWALMFPLICAWTNGWSNNRDAGDFKRHCGHYDVIVMNIMKYYLRSWHSSSILFTATAQTTIPHNKNISAE